MERIYEETLNRHFYTNDYDNNSEQGSTVGIDSNSVLMEDTIHYVIRKYRIQPKQVIA